MKKIFVLLLSPILAFAYNDAKVFQKIEKDLDSIIVKDLNKKQLIFQDIYFGLTHVSFPTPTTILLSSTLPKAINGLQKSTCPEIVISALTEPSVELIAPVTLLWIKVTL